MDHHDFNPTKDYYSVLGVDRKASAEQLKQARSKLAFKFHPDTNHAPDSSQKFRDVQDAYNVLSKPNIRQQYDVASSMSGKLKGVVNYSSTYPNSEDVVAGFRRNYEQNLRSQSGRIFHKSGDAGVDGFSSNMSREELRKLRRVQPVVDAGGIGVAIGGALVIGGLFLVVSMFKKVKENRAVDAFNEKIREVNGRK